MAGVVCDMYVSEPHHEGHFYPEYEEYEPKMCSGVYEVTIREDDIRNGMADIVCPFCRQEDRIPVDEHHALEW